jgi:hypothetical protein
VLSRQERSDLPAINGVMFLWQQARAQRLACGPRSDVLNGSGARAQRFAPAVDEVMSSSCGSGQKPRFLPAVDGVMSAEIAFGNFSQMN